MILSLIVHYIAEESRTRVPPPSCRWAKGNAIGEEFRPDPDYQSARAKFREEGSRKRAVFFYACFSLSGQKVPDRLSRTFSVNVHPVLKLVCKNELPGPGCHRDALARMICFYALQGFAVVHLLQPIIITARTPATFDNRRGDSWSYGIVALIDESSH